MASPNKEVARALAKAEEQEARFRKAAEERAKKRTANAVALAERQEADDIAKAEEQFKAGAGWRKQLADAVKAGGSIPDPEPPVPPPPPVVVPPPVVTPPTSADWTSLWSCAEGIPAALLAAYRGPPGYDSWKRFSTGDGPEGLATIEAIKKGQLVHPLILRFPQDGAGADGWIAVPPGMGAVALTWTIQFDRPWKCAGKMLRLWVNGPTHGTTRSGAGLVAMRPDRGGQAAARGFFEGARPKQGKGYGMPFDDGLVMEPGVPHRITQILIPETKRGADDAFAAVLLDGKVSADLSKCQCFDGDPTIERVAIQASWMTGGNPEDNPSPHDMTVMTWDYKVRVAPRAVGLRAVGK